MKYALGEYAHDVHRARPELRTRTYRLISPRKWGSLRSSFNVGLPAAHSRNDLRERGLYAPYGI